MTNNNQPHHIDELADQRHDGQHVNEGTARRTHNAFGRPIEEAETEESWRAKFLAKINGSHRTHNAFGRPLHKATESRTAFGRPTHPTNESESNHE